MRVCLNDAPYLLFEKYMSNTLVEKYKQLNNSFSKELVFHLGIDAGFFAEYSYMLHAMLYCLEHRIRFKLYSADANFSYSKGWTDYFKPFCEEVHEHFHHKYNRHPLTTSWKEIWKETNNLSLIKWKMKTSLLNFIGNLSALFIYKKFIKLNNHLNYIPKEHYRIPELGIDGDYLYAFQKMVEITWRFNHDTTLYCNKLIETLSLPKSYVACQIRGGDKITETSLLDPDWFVNFIHSHSPLKDVFVLTDDYRIYQQLLSIDNQIRWYTFCQPIETGYVNKNFERETGEQKKEQMLRFLASIQVMNDSSLFLGSITTGPSLFVLKNKYPGGVTVDCTSEQFPKVCRQTISKRSKVSINNLTQP